MVKTDLKEARQAMLGLASLSVDRSTIPELSGLSTGTYSALKARLTMAASQALEKYGFIVTKDKDTSGRVDADNPSNCYLNRKASQQAINLVIMVAHVNVGSAGLEFTLSKLQEHAGYIKLKEEFLQGPSKRVDGQSIVEKWNNEIVAIAQAATELFLDGGVKRKVVDRAPKKASPKPEAPLKATEPKAIELALAPEVRAERCAIATKLFDFVHAAYLTCERMTAPLGLPQGIFSADNQAGLSVIEPTSDLVADCKKYIDFIENTMCGRLLSPLTIYTDLLGQSNQKKDTSQADCSTGEATEPLRAMVLGKILPSYQVLIPSLGETTLDQFDPFLKLAHAIVTATSSGRATTIYVSDSKLLKKALDNLAEGLVKPQ